VCWGIFSPNLVHSFQAGGQTFWDTYVLVSTRYEDNLETESSLIGGSGALDKP
jgi:hypothetical protein